jgi:glycogen debranching enzyme
VPAEAEPLAIEDIRDALVIRESGSILLTDKDGQMRRGNRSGLGLCRDDTRHLSRYEFSVSHAEPALLLSTASLGFAAEQVLTKLTMDSHNGERLRRESIQVRRQRTTGVAPEEHLSITSYHDRPVVLEFRYSFDVDSSDIFEMRGVERQARGHHQPVERGERSLTFGYLCRDCVITSLQTLAFKPAIARQTLRLLAARHGSVVNQWRDEEPGKILHEFRQGELARSGEVPFELYYGSIDSTPLFLLLVAEYWAWTADIRLVRELLPVIEAALEWTERFGDRDGGGYLE